MYSTPLTNTVSIKNYFLKFILIYAKHQTTFNLHTLSINNKLHKY